MRRGGQLTRGAASCTGAGRTGRTIYERAAQAAKIPPDPSLLKRLAPNVSRRLSGNGDVEGIGLVFSQTQNVCDRDMDLNDI